MDRRPTGDTVPAPFEPAVTAAITGSRTVGSIRALTDRKLLVSSLRSVTSASTSLPCVATAAAFGHS
ncbi:hypothetical protein SsS58_05763 [Streptomyces scabiei]|uniref:Uncharacterized protein n=1 Tax=Streptomyces scabiei TaxID=1930 RepID=A0A100JTE3_STRSC|nr:hypothetical protein SsS58_05763 [Streptomyces scabiei]